ncbi:MAG: SMC-Scp complex subunit ScpB [Mesosutterella sp.]|nr:SMC-Scp complex subunit ScpB [Mesosutterella sp.]
MQSGLDLGVNSADESINDPVLVIEGALLTAGRPLKVNDLGRLFARAWPRKQILQWLSQLQSKWEGSAVRLEETAGGWRFVGSRDLQPYLDRLSEEKPPRYSRSFMETLAIIAYRQPVTRGDIEDIRGVSVNSNVMKQLQDRGWIECVGHRETPGRPALWATTRRFLQDFSLKSLSGLPPLDAEDSPQPPESSVQRGTPGQQGEFPDIIGRQPER